MVFTNSYGNNFEQEEIINTVQKPDIKIVPPPPKTIAALMLVANDSEIDGPEIDFSSETSAEEEIVYTSVNLNQGS